MSRPSPRAAVLALLLLSSATVALATPAVRSGPGQRFETGGVTIWDEVRGNGRSSALTTGQESLRAYLTMLFVSTAKRDEFVARAGEYRYTRSVNAALNADLGQFDMWPVLPTFRMPTRVLTGRYEMNVAPSTAWRIHQSIPGSRWEVFEQSGHLPYFEEPEKFQRVVEDILGRP